MSRRTPRAGRSGSEAVIEEAEGGLGQQPHTVLTLRQVDEVDHALEEARHLLASIEFTLSASTTAEIALDDDVALGVAASAEHAQNRIKRVLTILSVEAASAAGGAR